MNFLLFLFSVYERTYISESEGKFLVKDTKKVSTKKIQMGFFEILRDSLEHVVFYDNESTKMISISTGFFKVLWELPCMREHER